MAKLRTDCIEKPLRTCFEAMGGCIGSHPWWFLLIPLFLSAGLGSGFFFLGDRMSNDIEEQFTPSDGQAKAERRYIQETFPGNRSVFSSSRLSSGGNYATAIATRDGNILSAESLQEILHLDAKIRSMVVQSGNQSFKYVDICAETNGACTSNDILHIIENNVVSFTFPWHYTDSKRIPLYLSLGSVTLEEGSSVVKGAEAIQLYYYLQEDDNARTDMWLKSFLSLISNESAASIQVSYATSKSIQWEFEKSPSSVIHLFSITYAIAIVFSVLSCWRLDNVRTKVWVAFCGVFSTGLAVLSGFGTLLLIEQPFVMTAASCPFMILGIGLDDMFIMISCWQRTRVLDSVPIRLSHTYRDAAVSITITTLTDALALFLGAITPFGSIRSFCLYAGTCVFFCYLYSITFLGACMALNGRREEGNKHWFTFTKVPKDLPDGSSKSFSICCAGGRYDHITEQEETEAMSHIFKFYSRFLTHKFTKAQVCVLYVVYLAVSIYGCCILQEGLDIRNLALDDSYIVDYYNCQSRHFKKYNYNVMVAVKQPFPYWDKLEQKILHSCIAKFERLEYVNSTFAWFLSFKQFVKEADLNRSSFQTHLLHFLESNSMFRLDVNMTADNEIWSSRFFIQTLNNTTVMDMMGGLRKMAEECPVDLVVFHPAFIYFDQYTVIMDNTIQTILVAVAAMLLIALLLIPSLLCSLWVAFAICSVIVGVTGFMALWGVSLDSISMINLVMSIGFSVDFSAHITYSFVSSPKKDVNERAVDALAHLGYSILQGAVSTVLGVLVLSVSGSYIFRTFFKVVFLVITFGLLHGLMFIPVFLTLFGAHEDRCC